MYSIESVAKRREGENMLSVKKKNRLLVNKNMKFNFYKIVLNEITTTKTKYYQEKQPMKSHKSTGSALESDFK